MKKIISSILVFAGVLALGSSAFAATYPSEGGGIKLGTGGAETAPAIIIGLSPKVVAFYFTDGDTKGTAQWYAIGTGHPGGTEIFGTAQNLNNVYKKAFTPGTEITSALFGLPTGPNSASDWSDNDWDI